MTKDTTHTATAAPDRRHRPAARLPVDAPLVGLRLLPRHPIADSGAARKVQWLVELGERRKQRELEMQAITLAARSMQQTVQDLTDAVHGRLDKVAALAVELGLQIAREIVGNALEQGLFDPTPTVVRCLRDAVRGADGGDLSVYLNPEDLGAVLDRLAGEPGLREVIAATSFLPDASLQRGAVRADTNSGCLRYDPEQVFERMASAVRSAAAEGSS